MLALFEILLLLIVYNTYAQVTTETVDCLYFSVSPVLKMEIKKYNPLKHHDVMMEKIRRVGKKHGLHAVTVRKCIIEKYGVYL